MNKPMYSKDEVVYYFGYCSITSEPILFGNFYIYDLKSLETGAEFDGVWEDDIIPAEEENNNE